MMRELMSHEETLDYLRRAREGDESAKEELVNRNMGLVKSIVRKFTGRGVEYDDLMQIGCLGLVKAIMNFDASYDVRFSTYAVPMIAGEIKRFLRDDGMVKVSRSLKEKAQEVMSANERLKAQLKRDPTLSEISEATGLTPEEIAAATDAVRLPVSLNEYMFDDDSKKSQLMDFIASDDGEASLEQIMLSELIEKLTPKEKRLLVMRFFMDKTQSEIAKSFGVSQVQVSRLITKTLEKLRARACE